MSDREFIDSAAAIHLKAIQDLTTLIDMHAAAIRDLQAQRLTPPLPLGEEDAEASRARVVHIKESAEGRLRPVVPAAERLAEVSHSE